jgi:hypothetical protein
MRAAIDGANPVIIVEVYRNGRGNRFLPFRRIIRRPDLTVLRAASSFCEMSDMRRYISIWVWASGCAAFARFPSGVCAIDPQFPCNEFNAIAVLHYEAKMHNAFWQRPALVFLGRYGIDGIEGMSR